MADKLETVNHCNSKSKSVNVRVMDGNMKSPKEGMSIFDSRVVTDTGYYTSAEQFLFADKAKNVQERAAKLKKLEQNYRTTQLQNADVVHASVCVKFVKKERAS